MLSREASRLNAVFGLLKHCSVVFLWKTRLSSGSVFTGAAWSGQAIHLCDPPPPSQRGPVLGPRLATQGASSICAVTGPGIGMWHRRDQLKSCPGILNHLRGRILCAGLEVFRGFQWPSVSSLPREGSFIERGKQSLEMQPEKGPGMWP